MTNKPQTTKELAESALAYIKFHTTKYGVGFSFDANKYAKEILAPALRKRKS